MRTQHPPTALGEISAVMGEGGYHQAHLSSAPTTRRPSLAVVLNGLCCGCLFACPSPLLVHKLCEDRDLAFFVIAMSLESSTAHGIV